MDWKDYKSVFTWDGSWRDIYVLDADISDWQKVLELLQAEGYVYDLQWGDRRQLPRDAVDLFKAREGDWPLLFFDIGGPTVACHFFNISEIEFDLDPREIQSEREGAAVFSFIESIGRSLSKSVRITPEYCSSYVLMEFDVHSQTIRLVNPYE